MKSLTSLKKAYEKKVLEQKKKAQLLLDEAQELKSQAQELEQQAQAKLDHSLLITDLIKLKSECLSNIEKVILEHTANISAAQVSGALQALEEIKASQPLRSKLGQLVQMGSGRGALALALIARGDFYLPACLMGVFEISLSSYKPNELFLIANTLNIASIEIEHARQVQALLEQVQADSITTKINAPRADTGAKYRKIAFLSDDDFKLVFDSNWQSMKMKFNALDDKSAFNSALDFMMHDLQQEKVF